MGHRSSVLIPRPRSIWGSHSENHGSDWARLRLLAGCDGYPLLDQRSSARPDRALAMAVFEPRTAFSSTLAPGFIIAVAIDNILRNVPLRTLGDNRLHALALT